MPEKLKLKTGCKVGLPDRLYEGYEIGGDYIIANVGIDKIEEVMQHFIVMHDEPLFFILELPADQKDETEVTAGIVERLHKDVYYIDGCSQEEALTILLRAGEMLFHDGLSAFGFGCHESEDEIMFGKYNVLTIYSHHTEQYADFFKVHDIEKTEKLTTAWDTFSAKYPGISEIYEVDGKNVYDIPQQFQEWGIYRAEQREE